MGQVLAITLLAAVASSASAREESYDSAYGAADGYGAETLDERVAKLEKRLSSDTLMEMLRRVERLQGEVSDMRGKMEELSHEVDTLRKQQKDMYLDLDRRLQTPAPEATPPAPTDANPDQPPPASTSEATPAPVAAATPAPRPAVEGRQDAYDKAFNLLKEGKYPESVRAFKSFLSAYPDGDLADNAMYWTGEAYYVLRDFPSARDAFRKLIKTVPQSPKVPDALLKLAYIEYDASRWGPAREQLNDVIKRYPGSSAAKLAEKRLAKMKQEGH